MTNVNRITMIGALLSIAVYATQDTIGSEILSPTATLEYNIGSCDLVETESVLVKVLQALNVSALVLDERFREVNPPDVVTVLGESDGFDMDASNFAEREVLSIAIYHNGDDPKKALSFAEEVYDLLPKALPCAVLLVKLERTEK